ncbi:MAG: SWIM zinc finger domain-containing protein, partial [Bifidobacteriaceae bacterium]|nr:SWIM zinc finger domain-containing protein [Bifidobacteriaceae bacterium]
MRLELSQAEAMAPDQASLKAARGLVKPGRWPVLSSEGSLIWGEFQGSGANPYRVVFDSADLGYRCSCPSRKFPCKHALALMLIASAETALVPGHVPQWVVEWLGRRRRTSGNSGASARGPGQEAATGTSDQRAAPPGQLSGGQDGSFPDAPEAQAVKRLAESEPTGPQRPGHGVPGGPAVSDGAGGPVAGKAPASAAAAARRAQTDSLVESGLEELDGWIADQLRLGLTGLIAEARDRCRQIAARLVDRKAAALASRLDEFPARLLALPAEERIHLAVRELGQLALLTRVWRAEPGAPRIRRAVVAAESRADLLEDPDAPRVTSVWEVAGSRVLTRRDRLVSHATWLINLADGPPFALLQDYYPASSGTRPTGFPAGRQLKAEMVYYPGVSPVR